MSSVNTVNTARVSNRYFLSIGDFNDSISNINHGLKILQINVKSIDNMARFDKFRSFISDFNTDIDIIIISETWLHSELIGLYNI